jgi:hypothetical protein
LEITAAIPCFQPSPQPEVAEVIQTEMAQAVALEAVLGVIPALEQVVLELPTKVLLEEIAFLIQPVVEEALERLGQMAHHLQMAATVALEYRLALQAHL